MSSTIGKLMLNMLMESAHYIEVRKAQLVLVGPLNDGHMHCIGTIHLRGCPLFGGINSQGGGTCPSFRVSFIQDVFFHPQDIMSFFSIFIKLKDSATSKAFKVCPSRARASARGRGRAKDRLGMG